MTPRHSAWQAWHLATSTLVSRGRRGTWRHRPWFCVAGVALGDIYYFLRRTPSFTYRFVTHNSSHTTCFTSRSSTTSCVFPSISVPATTFVAHFWKKLTCGVIRSFNSLPGWRKWGWTKAIKATNSKNICPELRRLHVDTDYMGSSLFQRHSHPGPLDGLATSLCNFVYVCAVRALPLHMIYSAYPTCESSPEWLLSCGFPPDPMKILIRHAGFCTWFASVFKQLASVCCETYLRRYQVVCVWRGPGLLGMIPR